MIQFHSERSDELIELLQLRDADNRRGDPRLLKYPCQCNLYVRHASLPRDLGDLFDNRKIRVRVIELLHVVIGLCTNGISEVSLAAFAGNKTACDRAVWNHGDAFCPA